MTPSQKPQFKRLRDVTANELAYIANPVFARRQLTDKSPLVPAIPAGLRPQEVEDGEWVLLCDTARSTQPAALVHNKTGGHWTVHANVNGKARLNFQTRLNSLQPAAPRSPAANRPPASSSSSATPDRIAPAPQRAPTLGPHVTDGPGCVRKLQTGHCIQPVWMTLSKAQPDHHALVLKHPGEFRRYRRRVTTH